MVWDSALLAARASLHVPGGANTTLEWMHHSHRPAAASQHWNATGLLYGNVPMWPWHFATSLTQERSCGPGRRDWCQAENAHIVALATFLIVAILAVFCVFSHIREDKEEQITPLCPQLIVKGNQPLRFRFTLDQGEETQIFNSENDEFYCKILTDSYDPLRPAFSGVAATVRLLDRAEHTLATIVARSVAVQGQGICVCRAGCEIFGFVEPDEKREGRYFIRHRSDVNLLTLDGDWNSPDGNLKMVNPVGLTVFTMERKGTSCEGQVHQGTDAGLMLCTFFAAHVKRMLMETERPSPWGPFPSFPPATQSQFASLSAPLSSPQFQNASPRFAHPPVASVMSESSAASPVVPAAATAAAGGTGGTGRGSGKGGSRQSAADDNSDVAHVETEEP